jgi:hypothetical protein
MEPTTTNDITIFKVYKRQGKRIRWAYHVFSKLQALLTRLKRSVPGAQTYEIFSGVLN